MTKKSISLIVIFVFFFSICGCNKQNKINYNLSYNQNEAFGYYKCQVKYPQFCSFNYPQFVKA